MKKAILISGLLFLAGCATLIPLKVGPPRNVTIEITPERVARGEYLANTVTHCMHCHSKFNTDYYSFPPVAGTEGMGGSPFKEAFGIVYGPNITPYALGDWSDGEIVRAVTEGVNKEGKPLFPIMPYGQLRTMSEEDVYSIVAYLRSLKPIPNEVGKKKLKFPLKYVERTIPQPWTPQPQPDPSDRVAYGKYLATIASCIMCHTPVNKMGKPFPGMELAGGQEFKFPGGAVRSANITPDPETGIGIRTKENFIGLFKSFQNAIELPDDKKHENTIMPWPMFAGMTHEDLGAIYDYLRTVKPTKHQVEKYPTPTE